MWNGKACFFLVQVPLSLFLPFTQSGCASSVALKKLGMHPTGDKKRVETVTKITATGAQGCTTQGTTHSPSIHCETVHTQFPKLASIPANKTRFCG